MGIPACDATNPNCFLLFIFFLLFVASLVYSIREPLLAHLFNDNAQKRQLFKICTKMSELIE